MKYCISIALRLTLPLFVGVWLSFAATALATTAEDNKPDYQHFVSTHSFPYIAPKERQNQILQNYSKLSLGLTKAQVSKILGEPDYSQKLFSKVNPPDFIGSAWTYFFEKPDPVLTNLKLDLSVQIFFNVDGKIKRVVSNIKGLKEIGTPAN